jgi:hypothetical protein
LGRTLFRNIIIIAQLILGYLAFQVDERPAQKQPSQTLLLLKFPEEEDPFLETQTSCQSAKKN